MARSDKRIKQFSKRTALLQHQSQVFASKKLKPSPTHYQTFQPTSTTLASILKLNHVGHASP